MIAKVVRSLYTVPGEAACKSHACIEFERSSAVRSLGGLPLCNV